ncbi:regulatory protein TetR [Gordonia neofelifaecis NRRL B-59395]|uniref:Regulatory protein TetR n=2 Tax=Gordonia TaxID=2053 RepID=F1YND4_9ACTN|nr:regulatory protein TetR [Gordonia neofelifaecis NRRL B-59395]
MIRCAADLIARDGVAGTSIGDVLAAAGAARGSVYYYFPGGRSELMAEAVRHAGEEFGAELNRARRLPVVRAIGAIAAIWRSRLLVTDFAAGCPIAAGAQARGSDPEAAAAAEEVFLQWNHLLSARLREEDFDDRRAEELADSILSGIEGAVVLCRARRSVEPLDGMVAHLRELAGRRTASPSADRERPEASDDFGGDRAGDPSLG